MSVYYEDDQVRLLLGKSLEVLRTLPDESVDCCVSSPPYYGLRDYGIEGQYGLEETPAEYVEIMRAVFAEVRRVLAKDGTCWINLGDSYSSTTKGSGGTGKSTLGSGAKNALDAQLRQQMQPRRLQPDRPAKNLLGIPWRVAFALQDDGWILRNAIVWDQANPMPESVSDRLSTGYEQVFLVTRSPRYHFDLDAIRRPLAAPARTAGATAFGARNSSHPRTATAPYRGAFGRGANPGDIWRFSGTSAVSGHMATFPLELPIRCIKAGCKPDGVVLDPFSGSGTTGEAARRLGRKYVGIDLNPEYHDLAAKRFSQGVLDFEAEGAAA